MARGYTAETRYICSIYPGILPTIKRNYGPSADGIGPAAVRQSLFQLKPVPKGSKPGYFVLPIQDCFESVLDFKDPKGPKLAKPVPCEEILADLLTHWVGGLHNVPPGAKPGVGEIINATPSRDELLALRAQQVLYFNYWFLQGEAISNGQENAIKAHGSMITDLMILAADWLGERRKWSNPEIARDAKPCPFCQELISELAIVCPNCSREVQAIPDHLRNLGSQRAPSPAPASSPA